MKIAKDTVVSLDVELSDLWGTVLERSDEPVHYLHGGYGDLLPAVETALEGKQPGSRVEVRLEPEDAFGDYDAALLRIVARARFPEVLDVGMRFEGVPGESDDSNIFRVTDVAVGKVVLDGNHPYAGMAVKFACKVHAVRQANAGETAQGGVDTPSAFTLRIGK